MPVNAIDRKPSEQVSNRQWIAPVSGGIIMFVNEDEWKAGIEAIANELSICYANGELDIHPASIPTLASKMLSAAVRAAAHVPVN